jgi:hypothetical protein
VGGWPVGSLLKKDLFAIYFEFSFALDKKNLSAGGRTPASIETICAGTPPSDKDLF